MLAIGSPAEYAQWARSDGPRVALFYSGSYDSELMDRYAVLADRFVEVQFCHVDLAVSPGVSLDQIVGCPGIEVQLAPRLYGYRGRHSFELCHGEELDLLEHYLTKLTDPQMAEIVAHDEPEIAAARLELVDKAAQREAGSTGGGSNHFCEGFSREIAL